MTKYLEQWLAFFPFLTTIYSFSLIIMFCCENFFNFFIDHANWISSFSLFMLMRCLKTPQFSFWRLNRQPMRQMKVGRWRRAEITFDFRFYKLMHVKEFEISLILRLFSNKFVTDICYPVCALCYLFTLSLHFRLVEHEAWILAMSFASDGLFLASSSWKGDVILWDMTTLQPVIKLNGHNSGNSFFHSALY